MKKLWGLLLSLSALYSCYKVDGANQRLEGAYIGYFHRNQSDTARVSIRFAGGRFVGKSSDPAYPAIGWGTFELSNDHIIFYDSCQWPRRQDTSLVLSGSYQIEQNEDGTIRIWKQLAGKSDEFLFARQAQ